MKRKFLTIIVIILTINLGFSQVKGFSDPDSILVKNDKLPKVLLIGSWHFNYPGLDEHEISEDDKVNIYSDKRQKELSELLDYISQFNPTKIAVEAPINTGWLLKNYDRFKKGTKDLYPNERSQIGMRLVDRFNLDTIYGVDAYPLILELNDQKDSLSPKTYIDKILDRHYFGGEDEIQKRYSKFYDYKNKMNVEKTLLENFKYMNTDKVLDRGFGVYLIGGQFDSENYEGADALSMFWMNRNLRIFRNIQNIDYDKNDRILVLFGAAHISILKYLFECTPEFELIDFNKLGE